MKVILSRKGFDSSAGWMPSPILEDGRMVPLPIPSTTDSVRMDEIVHPVTNIDQLLRDLSRPRHPLRGSTMVHVDPVLVRPPGAPTTWRPCLGQTGSAASHLEKQGVGPGDVFLFFGWFRQAHKTSDGWRWKRSAPDIHVLFGWLEVDECLFIRRRRSDCLKQYPWLASHPHAADAYTDPRNCIYMGTKTSTILGKRYAGGGRFSHFKKPLQLTAAGDNRKRSVWHLPIFFSPRGRPALTYHANPARWVEKGSQVQLKTVGRGQEFVIDSNQYTGLEQWLCTVVKTGVADS